MHVNLDKIEESWLGAHQGSSRDAIVKELRRLKLWCSRNNVTVLTLSTADAEAYVQFLQNPHPVPDWVGPSVPYALASGAPNPKWRPFTGPLSPASARLARSTLRGFYEHLVTEGVLPSNPFPVVRQARQKKVEKSLSTEAVSFVLAFVRSLPDSDIRQARKRVILTIALQAYLMAKPVSLVGWTLTRENLVEEKDGLWLAVPNGKGGTTALPLDAQVLPVLNAYNDWLVSRGGRPLSNQLWRGPGRTNCSPVLRFVSRIFNTAATHAPSRVLKELLQASKALY